MNWLAAWLPVLYLVGTGLVSFMLGVWVTRILLRQRQEVAVMKAASELSVQISTT